MPLKKSFVVIFAAFLGNSVCAASVPRPSGSAHRQKRHTFKRRVRNKIFRLGFRSGGVMLWDEKQNISCERGVFQTMLGSVNPLPPSVFSLGETCFLEIDIESPVNDPPMTPPSAACRRGVRLYSRGGLARRHGQRGRIGADRISCFKRGRRSRHKRETRSAVRDFAKDIRPCGNTNQTRR